jgi:preprotein translocase subunit SecG
VGPFFVSLLNVLIVIASIFLICLVLIQRGKGGGLAGAFGGSGGSSAFGTKAGDIFTRITMGTALAWIALLMIQVILLNQNLSAWPEDAAKTPGVPGLPGPGGKGGDTELVPPPPTGVPSPASDLGNPAEIPPATSTGPSAPVPVSPLPIPKSGETAPPKP